MPQRYDKALSRNLAELQKALLIRTTLLGIEDVRYIGKTFTRIVRDALFNDYVAHVIKVFDRNSQSSSFWYLHRIDPRPIKRHAREVGYEIGELESVSDKLKSIRNGTHFHIDGTGVLDPRAIWQGTDLSGVSLGKAVDFAWAALSPIREARGLPEVSLLGYTREEARNAIALVEEDT